MTPPEVEYREIELTRNQVAMVSPEDYKWLSRHKWCASWSRLSNSYYAVRGLTVDGKRTTTSMHREILGLKHGDKRKGDHINHVTLDCRRSNLRIASNFQNSYNSRNKKSNSCGYKGVFFDKRKGKWCARIRVDGVRKFLGYFATELLAYAAYCRAAVQFHGEFSCLG